MSFRKLQWAFPLAVLLHNSEEALTMPEWVSRYGGQLPVHPPADAIRAALLVATLAAFAVTALSAKQGKQSVWAYLLFGYMATMLLNVFVPHLPATLFFRRYTPGVITAVLVNLPLMSFLLLRAMREQWVSGVKAAVYALLVPLVLGGAIAAFFKLVTRGI